MGEKFNLAIIDNSDSVDDAAIESADREMSVEKGELKGVGGFFKKIWKYNIFGEVLRQKKINEAKKDINESRNVYVREGGTKQDSDSEMEAIVSRFVSDYDETVSKDAGEVKESLNEANPQEKQIKDQITQLIKDYASGIVNEDAFLEEKTRIFRGVHDLKKGALGKGQMYADNLLEIARQIKQNVEHGKKLEEMNLEFNVIVGRAKGAVKTQANYNAIDKIVEKVTSTKVGRFLGPETVAVAMGTAYCIGASISRSFANSKLAAWSTFGATALLSTGIAAGKESVAVENERRAYFRKKAKGETSEDGSKRNEEMEKFRYETLDVSDLQNDLEDTIKKLRDSKDDEARDLVQLALGILARIQARVYLSNTKQIDLLSYSNGKKIEREYSALLLSSVRAKIEIKNVLSSKPELLDNNDFDNFLSNLVDIEKNRITTGDRGIESKNKAFNKMKTRRVAMKALSTLGIGLIAGGIAQEVKSSFDSEQAGMAESLWRKVFHKPDDHSSSTTMFENARRYVWGDHHGFVTDEMNDYAIGGANIKLPEGTSIIDDGNGMYTLMNGDHKIVDGLNFNPDGTFTDGAKEILHDNGIVLNESVNHFTQNTTAAGIIEEQKEGLFHRVTRKLWYDNDTEKFDQNELRTWWGGENYTGVDAKGNYVFNVTHMTPDGSFHADQSIDAKYLTKIGQLKMVFSLSQDTQNMVCEVPIDSNGNAIIEQGGDIAKLFFRTDEDGKAVFIGKFAEVVQSMGVDDKGNEIIRMLGTHVGDGIEGSVAVIDRVTNVINVPTDTSAPWFIPIGARTPMEKTYPSKDPFYIPPERENYYEREKLKEDYVDLKKYRNNPEQVEALIHKMGDDVKYEKYEYVLDKLVNYEGYDNLDDEKKAKIERDRELYNRRYKRNLNIDEYIGIQITRIHQQIENVFIKEAKVGEKSFDKSYYLEAPLVKGIDNAEEIILILDQPIGDAVLTIPAILAIQKYLEQTKQNKPMKVITNSIGMDLFECVSDQFPGKVEFIEYGQVKKDLAKDTKNKFIINAHKGFQDYSIFNLSEKESKNLSKVMSVDWASWMKEEVPIKEGVLEKYDAIPARILRNFEVMLGMKLFEDINKMDHFLEKGKDCDKISAELKVKYEIKNGEKVIVMSAGSSVQPKEYEPEKWEEVINGLLKNNENAKILFLEDPNPSRKERYADMLERVSGGSNKRVKVVNESPNKFNAIMSMADVVVTPDTGLGHYASALGTPNVMLILGDPVRWSTAKTDRIMHEKAYGVYREDKGTYSSAWQSNVGYYVKDGDKSIGASNIDSSVIIRAIEERINSKTQNDVISKKKIDKRPAKRKDSTSKVNSKENIVPSKKKSTKKKFTKSNVNEVMVTNKNDFIANPNDDIDGTYD